MLALIPNELLPAPLVNTTSLVALALSELIATVFATVAVVARVELLAQDAVMGYVLPVLSVVPGKLPGANEALTALLAQLLVIG